MMFKCNDCGSIFDYPKAVQESRGEFWGVPCWETMYYCPYCESEDLEYGKYDEDVLEEETDAEDAYFEELGVWKEVVEC